MEVAYMSIDVRVMKTFYDWCVENNRMDLNDRFDENKNGCTTRDIGCKSNLKYWFKCPRNLHESEQTTLCSITRDSNCKLLCRKCNSVAQVVIDKFGEDYLWSHWRDDNELSPWDVSHASTIVYLKLQCTEKSYHKYEQRASLFSSGAGCPYCINRIIHPNDSLATFYPEIIDRWSDKNTKTPWEYSPHSDKKVWMKCPKGIHDDYEQKISNAVTYQFRCKECSLDERRKPDNLVGMTFGRLTVESLDTESKQCIDKNCRIIYRWWCKCSCGNSKLKSVMGCHLTSGKIRSCGCLTQENCSQLQLKVVDYIQNNYNPVNINHEYNCGIIATNPKTNRSLPYDNEIILDNNTKLIIEVMGESHYKVDLFIKSNAEKRGISTEEALADLQWRDEYKREYALSQGYKYLAIPYWTEHDGSYKALIDKIIQN